MSNAWLRRHLRGGDLAAAAPLAAVTATMVADSPLGGGAMAAEHWTAGFTSEEEEAANRNGDVGALKHINAGLNVENADLREVNAGLRVENAGVKAENADLRAENADLKEANVDLSEELTVLQDKVDKLRLAYCLNCQHPMGDNVDRMGL